MSRRLIIAILVVLIIGVLGGAAVLVVQRLRQGASPSETAPTTSPGQLPGAQTGGQAVAEPTGDGDSDGLINSDETRWGTNPANPDTDGDGFKDGEEVKANHNPTIPGPNDTLPAGFQPGQNLNPLTTGAPQAVAVDQFFEANLDLKLASKNYTDEYRSRFPEDQRNSQTLASYVQQQNIVTKLPTPLARAVQVETSDTRANVATYLQVAGSLSPFSNVDVVTSALNDLVSSNDPASIRGLSLQVKLHQEQLLALKVPPSAANLQKLLLGYSELISATYDAIAEYPADPVKSAVALRQLETNDSTYIQLISQELERIQQIAASLPQ